MPKVSIKKAAKEAARNEKKTRDSYQNFAGNLGQGTDNLLAYSTYGFNPITRQRTLLEWIFRGSWLGGVSVEMIADDMTREGIELETELDPDDEQDLQEEALFMGTWDKINEWIKWGRLYGGSILVPLIDGQDVSTPLRPQTVGKGMFKGLVVLDRWMIEPSLEDLVQEPGPFIGMPKFYRVTADAPALRGMRIHYSRAFRYVGVELPYWQRLMENMWGISVIERLYDRMVAFDSATTGASQRIYKSFLRTLKVKDLKEAVAAGGEAFAGIQKFVDQVRRFQSQENITLVDAEDEFTAEDNGGGMAGYSDVILQLGQQLAGALQIPLVRMFGQSPAGLNSSGESDLKTYYDGIKKQQVKYLSNAVRTIFYLIARSKGIQLDERFQFKFVPLWQLTQKDKADLAEVIGRTIQAAMELGVITKALALKELKEWSHETGVFTNITDKEITEAENEPPSVDEEMGPGSEEAETVAKRAVTKELTKDSWPGDLPIFIETPKGTPRAGWNNSMTAAYGFIKGYKGADGDDIDCYVGPSPFSDRVAVIHQNKSDGTFDEHKCMVGFDRTGEAVQAYVDSFKDGSGASRIGKVQEMSMKDFKRWLEMRNLARAA